MGSVRETVWTIVMLFCLGIFVWAYLDNYNGLPPHGKNLFSDDEAKEEENEKADGTDGEQEDNNAE